MSLFIHAIQHGIQFPGVLTEKIPFMGVLYWSAKQMGLPVGLGS